MKDTGKLKKLKGKTISDVKVDGVNSVRIFCDDGSVFTLDTEAGIGGIPALALTKEKSIELVPMLKDAVWPFPTGNDAPKEEPKLSTKVATKLNQDSAWPFPMPKKE